MADYYPLIARAVSGLDKNTGENRRALYERARAALVNQLRGVDPPLDESDITRERLALEEAIRKLEVEAAKRARSEPVEEEQVSSLRDQGLRDFRDTVAEAQGLGEASAEATRSARAAYDDLEEGPSEASTAPEDVHDQIQDHTTLSADHGQGIEDEQPEDQDHAHDQHDRPAADSGEHYFDPPETDQPGAPPADHASLPELAAASDAALAAARPNRNEDVAQRSAGWRGQTAAQQDDDDAYTRPVRSYGRILKVAVLLMLIGAIAAAGYWQRTAVMKAASSAYASLSNLTTSTTTPTAPKPVATAEPAGRAKINDRIGSEATPSSSATAPAAAVAQKVVLYDEDPNDPKGKRYVGSAVWRTETVSPGPGLAPELAVRADVDIPERRMRMVWSLRRNTDKALPASHTIEIMYTLPADFADGGIGNVPGVLMKQNEQARGVPLAGLAVKVTNGYFLIGLSAVDIDKQRNIQLLKERDWFDIPLVYTNNKRAILAVEKGTPGGRAFEEAFRAWGE